MFIKTFVTVLASGAIAAEASATISVLLQADLLQDQNGAAAAKTGTYYLIASTSDLSFSLINGTSGFITGGSGKAVGSLLSNDDYIVASGVINSGYTTPNSGNGILDKTLDGASGNPPALSLTGNGVLNWTPGDPLALLWFPSVTTTTGTFAAGTPYGFFTKGTATAGFSQAWLTPNDGVTNYSLGFFNASGGGLSSGPETAASGRSSLVTSAVPEPTSLGLLGLASFGLIARRTRR